MNPTPGASYPRPIDLADFDELQGEVLTMETDAALERLALLLTVVCFRNTVLENYHSEWPEFTQARMKELMQETVNKLHTALHALFAGDEATRLAAWEVLNVYYPQAWDKPAFDQGLLRAIELTKRATKPKPKQPRAPCAHRATESEE